MNPFDCRKNTVAHFSSFRFSNGNISPKYFVLIDDLDEENDSIFVVTFTSNLKYKKKKWMVFVSEKSLKDEIKGVEFPYTDSLVDCNTCLEVSGSVIRKGGCSFIIRMGDEWINKIYDALKYAYRVDSAILVKLKLRLGLE